MTYIEQGVFAPEGGCVMSQSFNTLTWTLPEATTVEAQSEQINQLLTGEVPSFISSDSLKSESVVKEEIIQLLTRYRPHLGLKPLKDSSDPLKTFQEEVEYFYQRYQSTVEAKTKEFSEDSLETLKAADSSASAELICYFFGGILCLALSMLL